jgi:rsbT co-antagonist protein RsbR
MSQIDLSVLPALLARKEPEILAAWLAEQANVAALQKSGLKSGSLREQSAEFLGAFRDATQQGLDDDIQSAVWTRSREVLTDISKDLSKRGINPTDVALYIFLLKQPLFRILQAEAAKTSDVLVNEVWVTSQIIDRLGLFTTQVAIETRELTITRQQAEMMELSTPVVKLWEGILALPLIGTLDSERTQVVMENLLQEIVRTGAGLAIIDITGVPTVDTLVAQHLLKTVAAARLMGAECIISGIRPQIASTIVHLGVDLGDVSTKATLADAFAVALKKLHLVVTRVPPSAQRFAE